MTDTTIDFLAQLGDDLRLVAARATVSGSRTIVRRSAGSGRRGFRSKWVPITAAAASFLVVAGVVGSYAARDNGSSSSDGAAAGMATTAPVPGALSAEDRPAGWRDTALSDEDALYFGPNAATDVEQAAGVEAPSGPETIPGAAGVPGEFSKVIKTADLSIEIIRESFGSRFQRASQIAEDLGGFVTTQSAAVRSGSMVMRVPAKYFNRARLMLKELGVRTERDSIQSTDVTAEFVDLQARLEILQARKAALVGLLGKANSLNEILRLQNAVDDVLIRIEEFKGRMKLINDQSSKATITLYMHEEGVERDDSADTPSIFEAWKSSIDGFLSVVGAIVIGIGYLLPLVALAGLVWLAVRTLRRRTA
ncbi:MAG: DUF4349 domain-containing protein [Actinomycetota bacterium]